MLIDLDRLRAAPLSRDPFDHVVAPGFIRAEAMADLRRDYPDVGRPGSYPAATVRFGTSFAQVLEEIESPEMAAVMGEKLGVGLSGNPTMVAVRDRCRARCVARGQILRGTAARHRAQLGGRRQLPEARAAPAPHFSVLQTPRGMMGPHRSGRSRADLR